MKLMSVRIFFQNQVAIGRAFFVERIVRHRSECRFQSGKPFERGLRAWIFLAIQRKTAILATNRNKALVEMAALDGRGRALLAFQPQRIDILPGDALQRRHRIGADTLMRLRVTGAQAKIAGVHHERPLAAAAFHRHHLGTAGNHEILRTRHDRVGCHIDAGDAGTTEAIERDAAGAHVIAGIERRHPAKIAALRAALGTGAPDDVVDVSGVDTGTIGERAQHRRADLLRMNARECALACFANAARRPACVDDQRVNHGVSLSLGCSRHLAAIGRQSQFARAQLTVHAALRFPVVASAMLSHSHP
jgi:hypothetical protein